MRAPNLIVMHCAALTMLLFLFGFGVYSTSIDVAHHFLLIDFLSHEDPAGIAKADWMGPMRTYPTGSHWIAAALGLLIGSPYAAMWALCVVGVYVSYFALARLCQQDLGIFGLLVFVGLVILVVPSGTLIADQIVDNFFYSQMIGSAILFCLLLFGIGLASKSDAGVYVLAFVGAQALMWIHLIPALDLLGTVAIAMFFRLGLDAFAGRQVLRRAGYFLLFIVVAALGTVLHPSFSAMRELSSNDGGLKFGIPPLWIYMIGLAIALVAGLSLMVRRGADRQRADEWIVAATLAAYALMTVQLLMLNLMGEGSIYAVKKHFFVVIPLTVVSLARAISHLARSHRFALRDFPIAAVVSAFFATFVNYPRQPVMPIRDVTRPLDYAKAEVATALPFFQDGNIAVTASSVDRNTQYIINLTTFHVPSETALNLLYNKNYGTDIGYLMTDRTPSLVAGCDTRFAETSLYAIVPFDCPSIVIPDRTYWFNVGGSAITFSGWSKPEADHRWSDGDSSSLALHLPPDRPPHDRCLVLDGYSYGPQTIAITTSEGKSIQPKLDGSEKIEVPLGRARGPIEIRLDFSSPRRPRSSDPRRLAYALRSFKLADCK